MMKSGVVSEGSMEEERGSESSMEEEHGSESSVEEERGIDGVGGVRVVRDVFSIEGIFKLKPAKLVRKERQKKTYQATGTALQRPRA